MAAWWHFAVILVPVALGLVIALAVSRRAKRKRQGTRFP